MKYEYNYQFKSRINIPINEYLYIVLYCGGVEVFITVFYTVQ